MVIFMLLGYWQQFFTVRCLLSKCYQVSMDLFHNEEWEDGY